MTQSTVLIVDDENLVRWALRERLAREGHGTLEAGSAAEMLALMHDAVDLVLLDVRLPDGDGVDLLDTLRTISPDTAVILMTAYGKVQTSAEAIRLGAYDYISKPFNLDDVSVEVRKALETTRLRRQLRALQSRPPHAFALPPEGVKLEDVERHLVVQALERCGGNQTHAAELLGINRDQVRYRIEKFGLSRRTPAGESLC